MTTEPVTDDTWTEWTAVILGVEPDDLPDYATVQQLPNDGVDITFRGESDDMREFVAAVASDVDTSLTGRYTISVDYMKRRARVTFTDWTTDL